MVEMKCTRTAVAAFHFSKAREVSNRRGAGVYLYPCAAQQRKTRYHSLPMAPSLGPGGGGPLTRRQMAYVAGMMCTGCINILVKKYTYETPSRGEWDVPSAVGVAACFAGRPLFNLPALTTFIRYEGAREGVR